MSSMVCSWLGVVLVARLLEQQKQPGQRHGIVDLVFSVEADHAVGGKNMSSLAGKRTAPDSDNDRSRIHLVFLQRVNSSRAMNSRTELVIRARSSWTAWVTVGEIILRAPAG